MPYIETFDNSMFGIFRIQKYFEGYFKNAHGVDGNHIAGHVIHGHVVQGETRKYNNTTP